MKTTLKTLLLSSFIALALSLGPINPAAAGLISPELEDAMSQAPTDSLIPVIVYLKGRVDVGQFGNPDKSQRRKEMITALKKQADSNQNVLATVFQNSGAGNIRQLWLINGIALEATPEMIRRTATHPLVDSIGLDQIVPLADTTPADSGTASWNLAMIEADAMWALGYQGQGVVVATMDTGVDAEHNALSGNYRGGTNSWFDPNGVHNAPYDADGHGTQTMGVLVGDGGMGAAPLAQWIAVKIFDDSGVASFSGIHSGFQWLLDPDNNPATDDAPDIVSNSWGFYDRVNDCFTEFQVDIDILRASEIAVIFAGGNNGPLSDTSISPANNNGSLAVGALDSNAQVMTTSGTGPSACDGGIYPQLTAPGQSIYTADLTYGGIFPDMTTYVSGTSLAAPHIAGALALLRSALPGASVADMEQALWDSARDLGDMGPDNSYGYGLALTAAAFDLLNAGTGGGSGGNDPPTPQCIDGDGDGFFNTDSDASCGEPVDCNDTDPSIYPGAPEIVEDGVDQDCNGYDLTIRITEAVYEAGRDKITVIATSALGNTANLSADIPGLGIQSMAWNRKNNYWQVTVSKASRKGFDPAQPGNVLVSGPEGDASLPIAIN